MKVCRRCGESKPLTEEFYPHNSRSRDKFDDRCKACWRLIQAEKRARKGDSPTAKLAKVRDQVRANSKAKGWQQADRAPETAPETAPRAVQPDDAPVKGVELKFLGRLSDMRDSGLQLAEYQDCTLAQAVAAHRAKFHCPEGRLKAFRYESSFTLPRRYFLEVPVQSEQPVVTAGVESKKKGAKRVR